MDVLPQSEVETALRITPSFYDAALNPERWPAVLERMMTVADADVAQFNVGRSLHEPLATYAVGVDQVMRRRWLDFPHNPGDDPRNPGLVRNLNKPVHCRQLVTDEVFHNSKIYKELMEPIGIDATMVLSSHFETARVLFVLGLFRKKGRPYWTDFDLQKMQLYMPHFRKACEVAAHFYNERDLAKAFRAAFDHIGLATMIVDRHAALQYANPAANALLEAGDGVWNNSGKVAAIDSESARAFEEKVLDVAVASPEFPAVGDDNVVIKRPGRESNLLATVRPVSAKAAPELLLVPDTAYAIVYLNDPEQRYETDAERLQRLYALTETETRLVQALTQGASLKGYAAAAGVTEGTARVQLKSIFDKTGTHRQAELVALLARLAQPITLGR
jgi:DNA-binding CsgD family transcriptional regulator